MNRISMQCIVLLTFASLAAADVAEWSGRTPGTHYVVTDDINVEIRADGTFKFQSVTDDELDVIGSITIADAVTGTVTVHIARNPADEAGTDGATNVGSINLTNSHAIPVIGNLAELRITGDLGVSAPSVVRGVTGAVTANDLADDLTINDDLGSSASLTTQATT